MRGRCSWTLKPSPNPAGSNDIERISVAAVSPGSATIAGGYTDGTVHVRPFLLHWNGGSWTQAAVQNPGPLGGELFGVAGSPAGVWTTGEEETTPGGASPRASIGEYGVVPNVFGDTPDAAAAVMANAGLASTFSTVNNSNPRCNGNTVNEIVATSPGTGVFTGPPVTLKECSI